MRIPREFVDLLYAFFDAALMRDVLSSEQSVFEGDAGTTQVEIPVQLSRRYGKRVRVDLSLIHI